MRKDDTGSFKIYRLDELRGSSPEHKLVVITERMKVALETRVKRCRAEAAALHLDMEVVGERLFQQGYQADISSVKVAAYHIAQTELRVLARAYDMILKVIGSGDAPQIDTDYNEDE